MKTSAADWCFKNCYWFVSHRCWRKPPSVKSRSQTSRRNDSPWRSEKMRESLTKRTISSESAATASSESMTCSHLTVSVSTWKDQWHWCKAWVSDRNAHPVTVLRLMCSTWLVEANRMHDVAGMCRKQQRFQLYRTKQVFWLHPTPTGHKSKVPSSNKPLRF